MAIAHAALNISSFCGVKVDMDTFTLHSSWHVKYVLPARYLWRQLCVQHVAPVQKLIDAPVCDAPQHVIQPALAKTDKGRLISCLNSGPPAHLRQLDVATHFSRTRSINNTDQRFRWNIDAAEKMMIMAQNFVEGGRWIDILAVMLTWNYRQHGRADATELWLVKIFEILKGGITTSVCNRIYLYPDWFNRVG